MNSDLINDTVLDPLFSLLPLKMESKEARAMLLAIGLQESKFKYRKQIRGPAMGFWQFETAGVSGVLSHSASRDLAESLLATLVIPDSIELAHRAIHCNDFLAAAFARLLLWTLPKALPERDNPQEGWAQYLAAWRPGRPHEETWEANWNLAWETVDQAVGQESG